MANAAFVTDLTEVATQIAEAAAGVAGILNSLKIIQLSRKYYDLYNSQRTFYLNTFQYGVEAPMIAEMNADPAYLMNYAGRILTAYDANTGPFGGASTDTLGWWTRHANAYNSAPDAMMLRELPLDLARLKSDWTNYLFRFEESYYDTANDIRYRKRFVVHNAGLKQGTATAASLSNSLGKYQDEINDFSNQLATYGNGIARYVGYRRGIADTADNFNQAGYQRRESPTTSTSGQLAYQVNVTPSAYRLPKGPAQE